MTAESRALHPGEPVEDWLKDLVSDFHGGGQSDGPAEWIAKWFHCFPRSKELLSNAAKGCDLSKRRIRWIASVFFGSNAGALSNQSEDIARILLLRWFDEDPEAAVSGFREFANGGSWSALSKVRQLAVGPQPPALTAPARPAELNCVVKSFSSKAGVCFSPVEYRGEAGLMVQAGMKGSERGNAVDWDTGFRCFLSTVETTEVLLFLNGKLGCFEAKHHGKSRNKSVAMSRVSKGILVTCSQPNFSAAAIFPLASTLLLGLLCLSRVRAHFPEASSVLIEALLNEVQLQDSQA